MRNNKKKDMRHRRTSFAGILALVTALAFLFQGCSNSPLTGAGTPQNISDQIQYTEEFSLDQVPAYSQQASVSVHGNQPYFNLSDYSAKSFETYSDLDRLGRCGTAFACVGQDLMPTEKRGRIGEIRPTGWHLVKYAGIDGNYLYNRCHLIAYQLTAENANEKNLITGTRYLNVQGMLPYENEVGDYVRETGNHVLYRVTPIFQGDNLLASGVLMEAESVEDSGSGIRFCVYCYNVQPGITIDYATGDSSASGLTGEDTQAERSAESTETASQSGNSSAEEETDGQLENSTAEEETDSQSENSTVEEGADGQSETSTAGEDGSQAGNATDGAEEEKKEQISGQKPTSAAYIGNSNTMKFHRPGCSSVTDMAEHNKVEFSSREEALRAGYVPCKRCKP